MSLQLKNLTKIYGTQKAVNNISFNIKAGEIVGFLGPNGAGKSTTMKIVTCFLPPTQGEAWVGGFNVVENPMQVKQITGYLPEHNPLYHDLYVHEYLSFVGKLYGLRGENLKLRVKEMVELCGLGVEQNKRIEALSKGYRQRVGLAQALCDRVIVINRGEIVVDDTLENILQAQRSATVILVEFEKTVSIEQLKMLPGILDVREIEGNKFRIVSEGATDIRPEIFRFAADNNLSLIGLKQEENSLENVFRDLTLSPAAIQKEN